jgi:hypothetical protein
MKLTFFRSLVFLLLAPTCCAAQTAAPAKQSSPDKATTRRRDSRTLDETLQWIKRQMESSGSSHNVSYPEKRYKWHRVTSYGNLQLHDCQLTIEKTYQNNARPPRKVRYTIPLRDLSSANYEVDEGNEQFKYTPVVSVLFFRSNTKSMHWGRGRTYAATDLIEIEFGSDPSFGKDKIDQLGKAFLHLRDLCAARARKEQPADKSASPAPQ